MKATQGSSRDRAPRPRRRVRPLGLRQKLAGLALLALGAAALLAPAGASAVVTPGTTLSATKTATAHYERTFHWTIDKSVTPDSWDLFKGDSGTSDYKIQVTKDDGTLHAYVDGQICVTNGGAVATQNLQIVDSLTQPPSSTVINSVNVDTSSHPVLQPGETHCYDYSVDIPAANLVPGDNYKDTADVTITNHAGHEGTPFGPSPSATSILPNNPTPINDTIHVDDPNDTSGGSPWEFSASGSVSYSKKFSCNQDEGKNDNTATIEETGQSDSASVTVNCYEPQVTKDATTSFDRTYGWSIDKSADQSSLTLSLGQQFQVNYSVKVDVTGSTDSNHHVSGNIAVYNPAPIDATLNDVSDAVSGVAQAASVDCGVTFPYTLPAGKTLNCTYDLDLPNADSRTNTATATLQNYDYASDGTPTEDGTTDFTGTAAVDFSSTKPNEKDTCVDVSDTLQGALGTVCKDDAPVTFTYSRNVGPYQTCGDYKVDNTASFKTNDTGTTGEDKWSVAVHVPCAGGCTLTQGYWKTHSREGPAPYDDTWALLGPNQEDTPFFSTGQTWYQVFWTAPQNGNAYLILAHQYEAARLNQLNGASVPAAVQTAITQAATLLTNNNINPAPSGNTRKTMLSLAAILAAYNEGTTGPGHCSEDGSSSKSA